MNYGPNASQLERIGKKIMLDKPEEHSDPDGWYMDGYHDARRGRAAYYGSCTLAENQAAYLRGYAEGAELA